MILTTSASGSSSIPAAAVFASMMYFLMLRSVCKRTGSLAFMASMIPFEIRCSSDISDKCFSILKTRYLLGSRKSRIRFINRSRCPESTIASKGKPIASERYSPA